MAVSDYQSARRALMRQDPILGAIIKKHGPCGLGAARDRFDHFAMLVRAIVFQKAYRLRKKPPAARISKIGDAWKPDRSVASWYLWRSLENEPVKSATRKEKASR